MTYPERFDTRPQVRSKRLNVLPANPEQADTEKAVGLGRVPFMAPSNAASGRKSLGNRPRHG